MNFFNEHKGTTVGVLVIVFAFLVYFFFFRGPSSDTVLVDSAGSTVNTELSTEFVNLLTELRAVTLDTTFFSQPEFRVLTDLTRPLLPELMGRINPFLPIGE